jgi:flagellar biosynthesis protein FlhF
MEILVEQGASRGDCVGRITEKYGAWFHILREKKIRIGGIWGFFAREGVEIEFYIPPMMSKASPWQGGSAALPFPGSAVPSDVPMRFVSDPYPQAAIDFDEAKKRVLAAVGKDPETLINVVKNKDASHQQILDELKEIKEKINTGAGKKEEHPSIARIAELLILNDFSSGYIDSMLEKTRKELALETLDDFDAAQDRLLEWIGESISIYREPKSSKTPISRREGRIMVLVGPTGVGKTTTIAKLAAVYGIENSGHSPRLVRLITIDAFRIGARAQIEAYGEIMDFPVSYVDNHRDLRREIALYQEETDIILVDTFGKSPRDSAKLGEMKELLDACGPKAEIHLVLSASTKTSDIETILQQFEPFNYRSVVLTKLDETNHTGNVISVLAGRGKSISFITDGQKVPHDIKKAGVLNFLINLEGFKVNRDKLEKRFPTGEADQIKWSL